MQTLQGKRKRYKAPQARPRVGPSGPPRPEVSGKAALNREDKTNQTGSLIQKVEQLFGHPEKSSFSNLLFADLVVMAG